MFAPRDNTLLCHHVSCSPKNKNKNKNKNKQKVNFKLLLCEVQIINELLRNYKLIHLSLRKQDVGQNAECLQPPEAPTYEIYQAAMSNSINESGQGEISLLLQKQDNWPSY